MPWIKKQQAKFTGQERQTKRDYSSGESHYFFGKRYRLEVVYKDESPVVTLKGKNKIILQVRPKSPAIKRREVMMDWYRKELHVIVGDLITKWQKKMGVEVKFWGIKQMKTKWGACTVKARRIWVNLELAKKPVRCLEYIIVHELVHLLERHHSDRFSAYMDQFLPRWRLYRAELNHSPLGHDIWEY